MTGASRLGLAGEASLVHHSQSPSTLLLQCIVSRLARLRARAAPEWNGWADVALPGSGAGGPRPLKQSQQFQTSRIGSDYCGQTRLLVFELHDRLRRSPRPSPGRASA